METKEPTHWISVPVPRSVWQQVREFSAQDDVAMTTLCAEWVCGGVAKRAAKRGRHLANANVPLTDE